MPNLPRPLLFPLLGLACTASPVLAADYVCLETNFGDFCMELLPEAAPQTVANFLAYVEAGDYQDTLIHRSEPDFVIQGGGYYGDPWNFAVPIRTRAPVVNEAGGRSNLRGTVAMARSSGFPDSATSQWFINLADNPDLDDTWDGGFAVFAEIVLGMDVVDLIASLPVGNFSALLGSSFWQVPVDIEPEDTLADLEDFVLVQHAYRTVRHPALLPYQCSLASPGDTLTEFCGSTLDFPVEIDGLLFAATLAFVPGRDELVFAVQRSSLQLLEDSGQPRAWYANGHLLIPSVRTPAGAFVDVGLTLLDFDTLEFALESFTPR